MSALLAGAAGALLVGGILTMVAGLRRTPPALVGLARALYDANGATEALKTVEEAIQEDGRYAPAWLLLGEIQHDKGRTARSRAAYERYLQLEPTGDTARAVRDILGKQAR